MAKRKKKSETRMYHGHGYIFGEETTLQKGKHYCWKCKEHKKTYKVKNGGGLLKKVHFCEDCGGFVSKKERLYEDAPDMLEVKLHLSNGETEVNYSKYSEKNNLGRPQKVIHLDCGMEMERYDGKICTPTVEEGYYECQWCKQEKLLRNFI